MESPPPRSPSPELPGFLGRARRRAFALCVAFVLLLHAVLFGAAHQASPGITREPAIGAPMAVRTVKAQPDPGPAEPTSSTPPAPELPTVAAPPTRPRVPRAPRAPSIATATLSSEASARLDTPVSGPAGDPAAALGVASAPESPASSPSDVAAAPAQAEPSPASAPTLAPAEAAAPEAAPAVTRAASGTFLAAGEEPPPVYRTVLPAPVTLRYEVRRGFLRGSGEIRWQPSGDRYELHLAARIAGITLLAQTSQGEIGASGLAPVRFLDQRARRAAQAANFKSDSGTITFSGPSTEWPLLAGTQDRLSWMIQLVGIVAADPERATEGGRISMVLVGARGEASVRTLRFVGRENGETASGSVPALKFVVDARSAYDTSYEIWLDPARGYLPVHATARNGAGESEFDLLLERIEP